MNQNTPSASQIIGKPAKKPRRKHGLGPLQAKWLCKENVVWPQPPGLPLDQVNALMIRLMQEDMDAIEPLRKIMADAAYQILIRKSSTCSGNFFVDDEVLKSSGISDFEQYMIEPGNKLQPDLFL